MALFMQVGVLRMRFSSNRTETFPSQATLWPCSYIQRPAMQISRRCCSSLLALPGKSEPVTMVRTPSWLVSSPASRSGTNCGALHAPESERIAEILRVDAAQLKRTGHPIDRQHVRRDAIVDLVRFGVAYHFIEGVFHHIVQALIDLALAPEEALAVLHPLEIADRNAACIAENIRHGEDALGVDDGVSFPRGWSVRAFAKDSCLHLVRVLPGNLIFDGGGNGDFARLKKNVARAHFCAAARKLVQRLLLGVHPINNLGNVEALIVV